MESSEEDAGNATSASCRASAREKDVGLAEDVEPTRNVQHESSEARASCRTPAMSEYNFDGDSVPSPSTKDTSTEAILDMIDDFIDGPGASRRLPLEIQTTAYDPVPTPGKSASVHLDSQCESEELKAEITVPPKELTLAVGGDGESLSESICLLPAEPQKSPHSETFICANTGNTIALPQASSFIQVDIAEQSSSQPILEIEMAVITCTSNTAASEGLSEQHSSNVIPEQLFMHPALSASKPEVITEQPAITPSTNSDESNVSTKQPAIAPSFTSVEPKVNTEQLTIASSFSSIVPEVSTKQPVIASSSSSVELVVLPELPVIAPLCSSVEGDELTSTSVEPEVLIERPVLAPIPENVEPLEIIEKFVIVPSSSSTESEVSTEQFAVTASSSSESTSVEKPIITPLPSSVEPETLPEQASLCNIDSGVSIEQCVISPLLCSMETETLPELVIAPTSSSVETVQILTDTSECENVNRTVTCTTSSENRDNVTVELAESTSSECSVSESRPFSMEPTSRSPLKRRLIRPVPSDRRPDSTVSSTVDSQTLDILTTEQTSCEIITKDVSSSSDAVPHDDDSTKPEEISNVSEISICKAETSTAPLRKIKLVRPKVTPLMNYSVKSDIQKSPIALEKDQCQSTSSDYNSVLSSAQLSVEACNRVSLVKFENQERVPSTDNIAEEHPALEILKQAKDVSHNESLEKKTEVIETHKKMVSEPTTSKSAPSTEETLSANTHLKKHAHNNDDEVLLDMKKVPPIKLSLSGAKPVESKININHLEPLNINSDLKNSQNLQDDNQPSLLVVQDLLSDVRETKCDLQSKQAEHNTNVNVSKNDHKKIPPIKLSLSNSEHSSELTSGVKKSKTFDEVSVSHKLEESKQVPKLTIKLTNKHNEEVKSPVPKLTIKHLQSPVEKNTDDINKQASSVAKINIKKNHTPSEKVNEHLAELSQLKEQSHNTHVNQQIPNASKLSIKSRSEMDRSEKELTFETVTAPLSTTSDLNTDDADIRQQTPCVTKINIKPILKPNDSVLKPADQNTDDFDKLQLSSITKINTIPTESEGEAILLQPIAEQNIDEHEINHQIPTVTKINIKPIPKPTAQPGECQSKTLQPIMNQNADDIDTQHQIPSVAKINIKPVLKPAEKVIDGLSKPHLEIHQNDLLLGGNKHIHNVTKLNIKPIPKPPEKINVTQRKSSSSEISESEYSENDESTSTSDQASASDQGSLGTVPKVTIKLGKPGTESEGKFYTEKNIPKLTIKNIQHSDKDDQDKLKLVISQSADKQHEKVPKITIKTVSNVNPKLTIKPLKSPERVNKDNEIPKFKISPELFSSSAEVKENQHVPKITIKPVTKTDTDGTKTPKKTPVMCDSSEHIPVVTKLNIKPILKPTEAGQSSECFDDKVPVVSKLNIKPIIKPKDNEVDCSVEDVPKVIKLNIKPLKNPEESSSEEKDCDEKNADMKDNTSIPVVTKLNIKPIVKPVESKALKDSENQLLETGNSSDDNADHIPMVTKLNIKPIVKPSELAEAGNLHNEQNIPVVTKLNIKPLVKPEDSSLLSPKKESSKSPGSAGIPVLTKLNIKPIVKPDDSHNKTKDENTEKLSKNPSLVMKINKRNAIDKPSENEHLCNNVSGKANSSKLPNFPKGTKRSTAKESNADQSSKPKMPRVVEASKNVDRNPGSPSLLSTDCESLFDNSRGCCVVPENVSTSISNELPTLSKDQTLSKPVCTDKTVPKKFVQETIPKVEQLPENKPNKKKSSQINEPYEANRIAEHCNINCTKPSIQNYTLLKKLLSATKEDNTKVTEPVTLNCLSQSEKSESTLLNCNDTRITKEPQESQIKFSPKLEKQASDSVQIHSFHDIHKEVNESVTKPLEIITDKFTNQGSGQDSPRIILKINKTDHGASAKIITEETHIPADSSPSSESHGREHAPQEPVNDIPSPKKHLANSRRKPNQPGTPINMTMGKRLRSSRIVESAEKSPAVKRNVTKRPPTSETSSTPQHIESEQSDFEIKKIKLEQLLSVNKSLTITPVASKVTQTSPSKSNTSLKQAGKVSHNHSLLKKENCSQKNGNSKLHNILSNLHTKQMQTLQLNENKSEKAVEITPEVESNTSTTSSDVVEITRVENCHPEVQEMMINENSVCDLTGNDEVSQDPLEVENTKPVQEEVKEIASITTIELTPTPRKRGRPRKLPLSEGAKPPTPAPLPVPALEERPQRSLRLMREKPAILKKPRGRGRGRGRGGRRPAVILPPEPETEPEPAPEPEPEPQPEPVVAVDLVEARAPSPIDPTSSRIKLPRMTEVLDKSVAGCATPLTSRRRSSAASSDLKVFRTGSHPDSPEKAEEFMKSPEATRPKSGRGSRGGRIRTPRNRGRGRGGGRGAMYMKETMGIYGRVCGPATTTVQLFEEETCMMDDNATPSKPSHLLDEDSQSSVKSSTNDSNKMKKSKFADLFDSNKVWTAADVKEYTWPPPDTPAEEPQVMMIQEQVAMFLGVKSFKRRYPELKRRPVSGEEREYVLSKGVVSEALCDLGITAVDASEVLDIMLSDYPHKYEEYRTHQRERHIASLSEETSESKPEEKPTKVEIKVEKPSEKPEPPKVDPEKTRQDMAAAAIASAAEWNARANALRRPACVDLQSMTIHRRRPPPPPAPPPCVRPAVGFYPHALLPGQFQHWYRTYTAEQLRYFPLNTVLAAPPAPPSPTESSSESEGSWGEHSSSSDESDAPHQHSAKRKKLSRVKRSSQHDKDKEDSRGPEVEVETCRVCKLRLEANRKYTHERFLVCANCNAKLHPGCVELAADTIRKCREYAWQCAECKSCCACRKPQDDDKMLFCDLCDRGFHIYCVGLDAVPSGRWHCVECAICKSCGARDPNGLTPVVPPTPGPSTPGLSTPGSSNPGPLTPGPSTPGPSTPGISVGPGEWHHQTRRGPGGHKVYSHSLCTPCARVR